MTASKESLLENEATKRRQPSSSVNPIHLQQKRHNEAMRYEHDAGAVPEMQLSRSMKMTGSNTLAIYSSDHRNGMSYYTEIPFAAIHGMQTRPRSDCDFCEGSSADLHCEKGGALSTNYKDLVVPSRTFVEEVVSGSFTMSLLIATIANSASQFLVGYNIAVLNTTEKYIFPGHSTLSWSWAVAALAIGALVGSILGGQLSGLFGRKWALAVNALGFLAGGVLQTMAINLPILTLARFVLGIMSGVATVLVPIYLGELAPPHYRGMLGTVNQFALVVGILVADLLSFPLANENGWRYLLGVIPAVAIFQIFLLPFVVESPKYLLHNDPHDPKASDVLQRLRGYTSMEDVEVEVDTYVAVVTAMSAPTPKIPHRFDMKCQPKKEAHEEKYGILGEMVTLPDVQFVFFCSIGLHIGQQLCGVAAVFYYSTSLFEEIMSSNPLIGTTSIGAINVIFTYVALLLMDVCRRKSLLLSSVGGMILCCSGLIFAQTGLIHDPSGIASLLLVNAYVAFYAIGMGCIPFLWIAEMVEPRYVAMTMSICSTINWMANFVVGLVFPLMKEYLGVLTFVPFAVVLVVLYLFVWIVLPETRAHGQFSRPSPTDNSSERERIK